MAEPLAARFRRLRAHRGFRWGVDLALVTFVFLGVSWWQTRDSVHGTAPTFSLRTLDGATVTTESLRGKPTVLVFWAPWCGVCKAESSNVSQLQRLVGDHARVLSVASDYDNLGEVEGYVRAQAVDYPVLLGGAQTARAFHVRAFPTLYVIDAQGEVTHVVTGYTTVLGMAARVLL